jgi:hypothetical protein
MFRPKTVLLCTALIAFFLSAPLPAQDLVQLPVKKVELYKNGMGYFEHLGTVNGQQSIEIVLPSSQLNDILKSLTVLDLGHGQIGGVNYDSAAPLDRRLAEVPINLSPEAGLVGFLNQIRGAGIEIRTPSGVLTGKLMGAELKTKIAGPGATSQEVQLTVFTAAGEVQLVQLESAGALKLTEPSLTADLGRYLDLLDTTHQRNVRRLRIQTIGKGERQIYVGYTSESPIWKTTYRIVLDPKQKPLLQGWAIVDNTTPMDWLNVSLSLVSGAPISFIQDLSQPIYARRPVVPLPQGVQVSPQVYESTMASEFKLTLPPAERAGGVAGGMPTASDMRRAPRQQDEVSSYASAFANAAPMPGQISDAMRQQVTETALAQSVAEQFEYKIKQPVTIKRNESALLPIIQSDVEGEKVSIYKATGNEPHPRLAFWLKNSSGLTLDGGPVTVLDTNAFAGEGLIETVQPGESRLLSYAVDLGTEISTTLGSEHQRVERVLIKNGTIQMFSKMVEKKTYKIRNNNTTSRTIVIEHPVRPGWKLVAMTPAESSANSYRFKVESKPKSTTEFVVQEESPLESSIAVSSIGAEQIAIWVRERSIDPEIEKSLQTIVEKKTEINDLTEKIDSLDKEQNNIFKDQERIRGNLERLNQTPEEATLRQRYIRQLNDQENRLNAIGSERAKLDQSRSAAQKQFEELIQKLSLDKKL